MSINPLHHIARIAVPALMLPALLLFPAQARARLSGVAELSYAQYEAEKDGVKSIDASSFQQRYSLMYDTGGRLVNGRLGRYAITLGYEWASFDSRIESVDASGSAVKQNPSVSAGHPLYEGEIVLDPKELPFKFRLFSRNMNRVSFTSDTVSALSDRNRLVVPGITTDMRDGIHTSTGATLVFGIKNGMTNGYNAVFRDLPMFLLDYRDELHRDLKSQAPVDTRLRRLAFVSLNKKDNWLHYRTTQYDDYINKDNNYEEKQVQLGTVDHGLERKWINLTNWIKLSTDLQLTRRKDHIDTTDTYDLNLFAIATRKQWEARTFNYFSRTRDRRHGLTYERKTPLYVTGSWGADATWNLRLASEERKSPTTSAQNRLDHLGTVRVDAFKRSPFTFSQTLSAERFENERSGTLVLESNSETASTRKFSDAYGLFASYNVKYFGNDGTTSYQSHKVTGRGVYAPSKALRLELEEVAMATSGTRKADVSTTINPNAAFSSNIPSDVRRDRATTAYTRYVTTLKADWQPKARLRIGASATSDIFQEEGTETEYNTTVRNRIDYALPTLDMGVDTTYTTSARGGESSSGIKSSGRVSYTPNRHMEARLVGSYTRDKGSPGTMTTTLEVNQAFNYYFYKTNGVSRRVLELNETAEYTQRDVADITNTRKRLTLGFRYYPTSRLFAAGRAAYSLIDPGSATETVYTASLGASYEKLQASVDYSYGSESSGSKRREKRLGVTVRKTF